MSDHHADELGAAFEASGKTDLDVRLELAITAYSLKEEARAGWVLRGVSEPESVAAHSWGTALLCLLFAKEAGVDAERAAAIAVVHDLAESITGDVVARADPADRDISERKKATLEASAMASLLPTGAEHVADVRRLWQDYEDRSDAAARFARDMNLLDMCLQAAHYERERRYDPQFVVPSRGNFEHLDEFFVSAERRLESDVARRLFAIVKARYLAVR